MMVFNRPDLTKKIFNEVKKYKPEKLFVSCDGPRNFIKNEKILCNRVQDVFKNINWKCKVYTNYSKKNLGCKLKVSSSFKWFFSKVDKGIILEDDCLPHKSFFNYCEQMLDKHKNNKKILLISGNNFQKNNWRGDGDYYFSKYPHIWGWAAWKRTFNYYDVSIKKWPKWKKTNKYKKVLSHMLVKEKNYWNKIFESTYKNKIDTWDYQLMLGGWMNDQFAVTPNKNLVSHIGMGPRATHSHYPSEKKGIKLVKISKKINHPNDTSINHEADRFCWLRVPYQGIFFYFPFNIISSTWIFLRKFFNF